MSTLRCSMHRLRHQPLAFNSTVGLRPSRVAATRSRKAYIKTLALAGPAAGKARESKQIVHFKQGEEDVEQQELEYLHLEFDCTELLDLHGRDSYLLCDVTKAHDYLLSLPLTEGYSSEVIAGRRQLLDYAKEQVLLQEGRVQQGNKGVDVPVQLLPSALALLAQLNQNTAVADMATKLLDNWDMRKTYKRDLILSLAVVSCNIARDLLTDQKVAEGCSVLEEALTLLQSAGEPPLAPGLAADIQDAVDGFVVQRILDQLRGPMTAEAVPARRKAVQKLKDLLSKGSAPRRQGLLGGGFLASVAQAPNAAEQDSRVPAGGTVTADYIRLVVDCMASHEIVAMANWEQLARHASSTSWLYPGLLQIAATAHIAVCFKERRPSTIKAGMALLRAVPVSCEVLLLRAIGSVLLGAPEAAVEHIKAAAKAPADAFISWPHDVHATSGTAGPGDDDEDPDLVAVTHLPPGPDAYDFLVTHSGPDEPELLSGLCLYTEVFISKVVFAGFPDTSQLSGPACCLPYYFDSPQVQQQLEEDRERNASLTGSLNNMMNAVMSVQPLVQQFAESAKSASSQWGLRLKDAGNSGSEAKASQRGALTDRLADRGDMTGEGSEGRDMMEDEEAWEQQQAGQQARGAGAMGNAQALVSQVRGSASAAAQAAAANLAGGVDTVREGLENQLGSKWPAALAAAALAAVAVGAIVSRRGPVTAPQQQQQQHIDAAAAATVRALDKNEASKLVKRFQKAKAAALGSTFDASQLPSVCIGPALEQFQSMTEDWSAQGWFRTSNVWKVEIQRVEPRSHSGQRVAVLARIGETSNTWGVDGQQGNSWSNEYDVEYDVVLCSDRQWRIQGLQVRGQEPGASKGWFGGR